MMSLLFKGDPAAALTKTQDKIAAIGSNIAQLQATRTAKLVIAEDAAEVLTVDRAIEAERVNLQIYRDKAKALQEEVRRGVYAEREKQRKQAIEKISAKLDKRTEIAAKLQTAIESVSELYFELMERDEIELLWPFGNSNRLGFHIDKRSVDKECSWALYGMLRPREGRPLMPEPSAAGLGVTGIRAEGIDTAVKAQNQALIARLEMTSLHDDLLDEAS